MFYTLRHLSRFGISRAEAISRITSDAGDIIGINNLGQIRPGFKSSLVIWNGDPLSILNYPIMVVAEGKIAFQE